MTTKAKQRLRPGELDELVLAYLEEHKSHGPLTATAIGKGIGRSSGAVANCLARLVKAKLARLAKKSPRAYVRREAKAQ
jgi:DNA-binding PadR family transcriptional regulator